MLLFVIFSFCFPGKISSEWKDDVVGTDVLWSFVEKKTEGATRGALWKKVFLKISQNSQESTCARVSFLNKPYASAATLLK